MLRYGHVLYFIAFVIIVGYKSALSELEDNTTFYDLFQMQEHTEGSLLLQDKQGCSKKGTEWENGEQSWSSRLKHIPEGKGEGSNIPFHYD